MWLAPVQIKVLPIGLDQHPYAEEVTAKLRAKGLRVELDEREEKIGYNGDAGCVPFEEFLARAVKETEEKYIEQN